MNQFNTNTFDAARAAALFGPNAHTVCPALREIIISLDDSYRADAAFNRAALRRLGRQLAGTAYATPDVWAARAALLLTAAREAYAHAAVLNVRLTVYPPRSQARRYVEAGRRRLCCADAALRRASCYVGGAHSTAEREKFADHVRSALYSAARAADEFEQAKERHALGDESPEHVWTRGGRTYRPAVAALNQETQRIVRDAARVR
ncbi:hypothetical protein [Burkholderia cepacia]|uniref:hypothetical protein n=1 Tax=Burkholderia cepacia TaxID=292 RepID=UPI00158D6101|nr:hypothetical protein [Burkholderia cepacia]